ncbi:MAG: hypothetical protein U9R58_10310 [Chloroflexota bacterium]|nr:hypothetical protein [Chloroflexota bacterium]
MSQTSSVRKPVVDWLTVVAIAAIAISFTVAFHEGVHAITCLAVGGNLQEYSALYESCDSLTESQAKIVAGSAPTYNLIAGFFLWIILRNSRKQSSEIQFFLWLFMLMNWFYGAGYFIFSGITNVGDWAVVINGWEPSWVWRIIMTIVGTLFFVLFVRLGLQEFGKMIGGDGNEQIRRGNKLCILSYITSFVVVLMAGFFCPYGLLSLPVTAGLFAVIGALSPLLWMMRWFQTESFVKLVKEPLEIHRKWQWLVASAIVVFTYVFILGRTLYF